MVAGIVIAVPLVLWGIAEFSYQQRINTLKREVENAPSASGQAFAAACRG